MCKSLLQLKQIEREFAYLHPIFATQHTTLHRIESDLFPMAPLFYQLRRSYAQSQFYVAATRKCGALVVVKTFIRHYAYCTQISVTAF